MVSTSWPVSVWSRRYWLCSLFSGATSLLVTLYGRLGFKLCSDGILFVRYLWFIPSLRKLRWILRERRGNMILTLFIKLSFRIWWSDRLFLMIMVSVFRHVWVLFSENKYNLRSWDPLSCSSFDYFLFFSEEWAFSRECGMLFLTVIALLWL